MTIINCICLKCYSAYTVAECQHRWFSQSLALQSHSEITPPRFPYLLLTLQYLAGHIVGEFTYWLSQTEQEASHSRSILYIRKALPLCRPVLWLKRIACMVQSIITWLKVEEQNAQCGTLFYLLTSHCSPWVPFLFFSKCVTALLPRSSVSALSLLLPWVTSSVCASHGSPAYRDGGRRVRELHCWEVFFVMF